MDYGLIEWCNGLRTYDMYIYAAFTQYPSRYLYPTFSESDSYRIRYSLFVSVTESIRIRICIRTLSVSESESEQKYENKYNMSDIRSYLIRFHPYLLETVLGIYTSYTRVLLYTLSVLNYNSFDFFYFKFYRSSY